MFSSHPMHKNVGNLSKKAFTHPIVVFKSGLKNNWMKKLDRMNRPLDTTFKFNRNQLGTVSAYVM